MTASPERLALAAVLLLAGCATAAQADSGSADLTIVTVGATVRYVTLDLNPATFTLGDGQSRSFHVKPGSYVVVPAPPIPGGLRIECSNGQAHQVDLADGDDVTCTFTFGP